MALGGEVVDLGRPDLLHQPDQVGRIRHVAIVQEERHVAGVAIFVQMIDTCGVERGRSPLDAVHDVPECEQIFGEVGAVLTGHAGEKRNAPFGILSSHVHSNKAPDCPNSSSTPTNLGHCAGLARDTWPHRLQSGAQTRSMTLFVQANLARKATSIPELADLRDWERWPTIRSS